MKGEGVFMSSNRSKRSMLFVEEGTQGTRAAQEAKLRNSQLRVILK